MYNCTQVITGEVYEMLENEAGLKRVNIPVSLLHTRTHTYARTHTHTSIIIRTIVFHAANGKERLFVLFHE